MTHATDLFKWTKDQSAHLRSGEIAMVDIMNVSEEIESMGRSIKRELSSRLRVLLMHLLKWNYQERMRSSSWRSTINSQRYELKTLLEESPSLNTLLEETISKVYASALKDAISETGLGRSVFPVTCPWDVQYILNSDIFSE